MGIGRWIQFLKKNVGFDYKVEWKYISYIYRRTVCLECFFCQIIVGISLRFSFLFQGNECFIVSVRVLADFLVVRCRRFQVGFLDCLGQVDVGLVFEKVQVEFVGLGRKVVEGEFQVGGSRVFVCELGYGWGRRLYSFYFWDRIVGVICLQSRKEKEMLVFL